MHDGMSHEKLDALIEDLKRNPVSKV